MKALIINQFGGPEQLHLEEVAMPVAKKGEVLVKIIASSVNPIDYKIRNGSIKFISGKKFPKILGGDLAGIVQQDSKHFRTGDKVFGMLTASGGGYAEFAAVPEDQLCLMPASCTFEDAAGIPLAGLTALQALQKGKPLSQDSSVLINGASGGVGSLAVQIAKALGAAVTAVTSTSNLDFVKNLGADKLIDYKATKFYKSPEKYQLVFDAVGSISFFKAARILSPGGVYVTTLPNHGYLFWRIFNLFRSKKAHFIMTKAKGADLKLIATMMEKGQVKAVIDSVFSLADGALAHHRIESHRAKGKIILKVQD